MKLLPNTLEDMNLLTKGVNKGCYKKGSMIYKLMESCKGCGKPYLADIYAVKKGKGIFCDQSCQCKGKNNPFYGKKHTQKSKSKQGVNSNGNPSTLKFWLNKGLSRAESKKQLNHHNKCNSNRCIEFWLKKGFTKENAIIEILKVQSENGKKVKHVNSIPTQLGYWLSKGYTKKQSLVLLKERQTTFSLDICIKNYGEVKGRQIWKDRQEKWQKTFNDKTPEEIERINRAKFAWGKNTGYSKISQELFWILYDTIKNDFDKIYFAQLGKRKGKDVSGKNHEFFKILPNRNAFFDFFIKDNNKIIEFDGDYWHSESRGNVERDKQRDKDIIQEGYQILHIRERDWKQSQNRATQQCMEFIYENN